MITKILVSYWVITGLLGTPIYMRETCTRIANSSSVREQSSALPSEDMSDSGSAGLAIELPAI